MQRTGFIAVLLLVVSSALIARRPPAQGRGGRGGRGAPDPRSAGGGNCAANPYSCIDTANPLPQPDTVWMEDMTWMDVRDAMKAGKKTVLIATGGIEPNGPWLALGKHQFRAEEPTATRSRASSGTRSARRSSRSCRRAQ